MKKRLAIWIFGGIGTGHFSQGYPVLERLLERISDTFEIVLYSRSAMNPGYFNRHFIIRTAPANMRLSIMRWLTLIFLFLADHTRKKFDLTLAFWGWPSGWIVTLLGNLLQIPNAVYVMGGDAAGIASINYGVFHRPWLRRIALWTYNRTSLLLAISQYQKDQLKVFGVRRDICVIPWGADPSQYAFHYKNQNGIFHFIHVGHLTPVKDQVTLLKAFALINGKQSSVLHIFGGDYLNGAIQRLCHGLNIEENVRFFDMVPYSKMPEHYRWADIMLHTSLSEGQSMALTEAAACGVLMAGTRVGLLYDLSDTCGIIVDKGDYESLAEQVLAIIKNRREWDSKIFHAKAWSEQHTFDWTIEELTKQLNLLRAKNN